MRGISWLNLVDHRCDFHCRHQGLLCVPALFSPHLYKGMCIHPPQIDEGERVEHLCVFPGGDTGNTLAGLS